MQDSVIDDVDYVGLGLACADVCQTLDRVMKGGGSDRIGETISKAIERFAT